MPQLDPLTGDTITLVRRWVAMDPSGNLGFRDQLIQLTGAKRQSYGTIKLGIWKEQDISDARFMQGAGTNGINLRLKQYNPSDTLELVDSFRTDSWQGQKGTAYFTPLQEAVYQLEIELPTGDSVLQSSEFSKTGVLDSLMIGGDTIVNLGLVTLIPTPPMGDTTDVVADSGAVNVPVQPVQGRQWVTTKIYPNPSYGYFEVEVNSKNPVQYVVRDMSGRLIREGQFVTQTRIDLSSAPHGVYSIVLQAGDDGWSVEKLIKME